MDRIHKILLGLSLLPMGAAVGVIFRPGSPVAVAEGEERSSLVFRQYAVHLGEVQPSPRIGADFHFRNRSETPVKITSISPSCGCLVTRLAEKKEEYQPGEFGLLQMSLATANEEPGFHDYAVTVTYDDAGRPREQILRFSLTLPAPTVQIEPSEMYFYQISEESDSRVLHVVDYRDKPLEVSDVSLVIGNKPCPVEVAFATVEPSEVVEGTTRIPIRIDVAAVPPGTRIIAHVVMTTTDEEFKTLKAPILIQGPTSRGVTPAKAESSEGNYGVR